MMYVFDIQISAYVLVTSINVINTREELNILLLICS